MKNIKLRKLNILNILSVLMVFRLAAPVLSNIFFFKISFVFFYGVAFIVLFLLDRDAIRREDVPLIVATVLFTGYFVLISIFSTGEVFGTKAFNMYIILFLTIIYIWLKKQSPELISWFFKLILITLLFNYIYSIIILSLDPMASRIAATGEGSKYDIFDAVGGFGTVYGGIFCVLLLLNVRSQLVKLKERIFILIIAILGIVFVFMSSYATALFLLILGLLLYYFDRNIALSFVSVFIFSLLIVFHRNVGDFIMSYANNSNGNVLSGKVYDFGYMIKELDLAGTYAGEDGRFNLIVISIETFLKHPFFGGYLAHGYTGGHSELFDTLAFFGIIGLLLMICYFVFLYRNVIRMMKNVRLARIYRICYILFVLLSIVNPSITTLTVLPLILVFPMSASYISVKNREPILKSLHVKIYNQKS